MGKGIITSYGHDPLGEYAFRISTFNSQLLSDDVRQLLSGQVVNAADGVRELTTAPAPSSLHRLSVRRPNEPYVVDIFLRPVEPRDNVSKLDGRSSTPSPDQWGPIPNAHIAQWELFNCVIHSVKSRDN